jgi:hypothetical protein
LLRRDRLGGIDQPNDASKRIVQIIGINAIPRFGNDLAVKSEKTYDTHFRFLPVEPIATIPDDDDSVRQVPEKSQSKTRQNSP